MIGLIDIFVNFYDVEARYAFFLYLYKLSNKNYEYFTDSIKWLPALK